MDKVHTDICSVNLQSYIVNTQYNGKPRPLRGRCSALLRSAATPHRGSYTAQREAGSIPLRFATESPPPQLRCDIGRSVDSLRSIEPASRCYVTSAAVLRRQRTAAAYASSAQRSAAVYKCKRSVYKCNSRRHKCKLAA